MVISGGNYQGKKDAGPKTSEVVSLLLGDDDLEEKCKYIYNNNDNNNVSINWLSILK